LAILVLRVSSSWYYTLACVKCLALKQCYKFVILKEFSLQWQFVKHDWKPGWN